MNCQRTINTNPLLFNIRTSTLFLPRNRFPLVCSHYESIKSTTHLLMVLVVGGRWWSLETSINLSVSFPALNPAGVETGIFPQCVNHSPKKAKFKLTIALNFSAFTTYCSSSPLPALWQYTEAVSLVFDSQVMLQDAAYHCHSAAYPFPVWHVWQTPSPINSSSQLGCYL